MHEDVVAVLGGSGFIGSELVAKLLGQVRELRVVSRSQPSLRRAGIEYRQGDVEDRDSMVDALRGATVVVQLTIESHFQEAASNVASVCLLHGIRRYIYTSTSDALYLGSGRRGARAERDPKPQLRNAYSRGKAESEAILERYFELSGLPVVILRPALVVGRGGKLTHGGIGKWRTPTALFGWGDGRNQLPFVLVQDVVSAMVSAIHAHNIEGMAFNLAGDVSMSAREWIEALRGRGYRDYRFFARSLPRMQATMALKSALKLGLRGSANHQYYRDMRSSAMRTPIDNGDAKRLLNWRPNQDSETFLREAVDWHFPALSNNDLRLAKSSIGARAH